MFRVGIVLKKILLEYYETWTIYVAGELRVAFLEGNASVILTIPIVSDRLHNILSQT